MEHSAEEDEFRKTGVHDSRCGDDGRSKKKNLYSRGAGDERHTVDWSNASRTTCRVDILESSSSTQLVGIVFARERLQCQESFSSQEAFRRDFQHPHRVYHVQEQFDGTSQHTEFLDFSKNQRNLKT